MGEAGLTSQTEADGSQVKTKVELGSVKAKGKSLSPWTFWNMPLMVSALDSEEGEVKCARVHPQGGLTRTFTHAP